MDSKNTGRDGHGERDGAAADHAAEVARAREALRCELTPKQRQVLETIARMTEAMGYAPTVRELLAPLGVRSTNTVVGHIDALVSKGYLSRSTRLSRTMRVLKMPTDGTDTTRGPLSSRG